MQTRRSSQEHRSAHLATRELSPTHVCTPAASENRFRQRGTRCHPNLALMASLACSRALRLRSMSS